MFALPVYAVILVAAAFAESTVGYRMDAVGGGRLARGGLALLFGTAVLTTTAYFGVMVLVLRVLGWDFPGAVRFVNVLVPTIFLNALAMPFAAAFARRVDRALSGWQRLELE